MIQITIKRNNVVTNGPANFETQELADNWLSGCLSKGKFGKHERWVLDNEEDTSNYLEFEDRELEPAYTREIPAVVDESGNEIEPARIEEIPANIKRFYKLAAEYEIIKEDVIPSYSELRVIEYQKIDKMKMEAIIEHFEGRPEKMTSYLELRAAIKIQYPKPA